MGPLQIILRAISIVVLPILLFVTLLTINTNTPIHFYLMWLLLLGIIVNWISWGIWGGIITALLTSAVSVYAWMVAGKGIYTIEIIPAFILILVLYYFEERIQKTITIKNLELDEKEHSHNLLLQEHKKQEGLRESYYKKTKRFNHLSQIVKELGFSLTPEEIKRSIISNLIKTIEGGDVYALYGVTSDLQNLELQVLESPAGIHPSESLPNDEFNSWVMRNRQPLIVTDVSKDYRFNTTHILKRTRTRSLIVSPLITGDRLLGVIRLDSYKPDVFTIDDLRLLAIISNIGTLTIYNAQLFKKTEYLAIRDDLTGLYVKRYFQERLEKLIQTSKIEEKSFSILLLDLDKFKDLNDQFGHSIGDRFLVKASRLMVEGSGPEGITARYGGEEFAILLPHTTKIDARSTAERIRLLIQGETIAIRREGASTTVSIGLAEFPGAGDTANELIAVADKHLYEAKRGGRNRVVG